MIRDETTKLRRLLADRKRDQAFDDLHSIASGAFAIVGLLRSVRLSAKQRRLIGERLEAIANEMTMAWQFLDDRRPGRG